MSAITSDSDKAAPNSVNPGRYSGDWLRAEHALAPHSAIKAIAYSTLVVIILGLFHEYLVHSLDYDGMGASIIDLDAEEALGAWWSSLMLFGCALLLFIAGRREQVRGNRYARHWLFLALVFVALSIDEACSIHEGLSNRLNLYFETYEYFEHSWVIPAAIGVLILGIAYLPFVRALPQKFAILFFASGAIFLSGALGLETLSGFADKGSNAFIIETLVEEILELIGVTLFLSALILWLAEDSASRLASLEDQ